MQRKVITSASIKSVGWKDNVLQIEFTSGGVYDFIGVSKPIFMEFMGSQSKGHYFVTRIKSNYKFVPVNTRMTRAAKEHEHASDSKESPKAAQGRGKKRAQA
jgi:hypothetical protein